MDLGVVSFQHKRDIQNYFENLSRFNLEVALQQSKRTHEPSLGTDTISQAHVEKSQTLIAERLMRIQNLKDTFELRKLPETETKWLNIIRGHIGQGNYRAANEMIANIQNGAITTDPNMSDSQKKEFQLALNDLIYTVEYLTPPEPPEEAKAIDDTINRDLQRKDFHGALNNLNAFCENAPYSETIKSYTILAYHRITEAAEEAETLERKQFLEKNKIRQNTYDENMEIYDRIRTKHEDSTFSSSVSTLASSLRRNAPMIGLRAITGALPIIFQTGTAITDKLFRIGEGVSSEVLATRARLSAIHNDIQRESAGQEQWLSEFNQKAINEKDQQISREIGLLSDRDDGSLAVREIFEQMKERQVILSVPSSNYSATYCGEYRAQFYESVPKEEHGQWANLCAHVDNDRTEGFVGILHGEGGTGKSRRNIAITRQYGPDKVYIVNTEDTHFHSFFGIKLPDRPFDNYGNTRTLEKKIGVRHAAMIQGKPITVLPEGSQIIEEAMRSEEEELFNELDPKVRSKVISLGGVRFQVPTNGVILIDAKQTVGSTEAELRRLAINLHCEKLTPPFQRQVYESALKNRLLEQDIVLTPDDPLHAACCEEIKDEPLPRVVVRAYDRLYTTLVNYIHPDKATKLWSHWPIILKRTSRTSNEVSFRTRQDILLSRLMLWANALDSETNTRLDKVLGGAVPEKLPLRVEVAAEQYREEYLRRTLEEALYEAGEEEKKYNAVVDPKNNELVVRRLEASWNEALKRVEAAKRDLKSYQTTYMGKAGDQGNKIAIHIADQKKNEQFPPVEIEDAQISLVDISTLTQSHPETQEFVERLKEISIRKEAILRTLETGDIKNKLLKDFNESKVIATNVLMDIFDRVWSIIVKGIDEERRKGNQIIDATTRHLADASRAEIERGIDEAEKLRRVPRDARSRARRVPEIGRGAPPPHLAASSSGPASPPPSQKSSAVPPSTLSAGSAGSGRKFRQPSIARAPARAAGRAVVTPPMRQAPPQPSINSPQQIAALAAARAAFQGASKSNARP